jgi:CubicO group peptidase (beta-lactamase class C family)
MSDWLAPAIAYARSWLEFQRRIHELPGLQCVVASKSGATLDLALGVASLKSGEALTPNHRLRVASHSKTFTAVGIMRLVEAGRLRLDDKAGSHIAGLHPETAEVTVAQLLSHGGGIIRDGEDAGHWQGFHDFPDEVALRAALKASPLIPTNTRFKYSNHGFGLAGLIIEAVTGEPFGTWMAREVVAKAGLTETLPEAPVPNGTPFADGHAARHLLGARYVVPMNQSTHALAAATGFVSTARDLATFIAQIDPDATTSLLSVASRREMVRRQWRVPDTVLDRHYGLGTIHGGAGDKAWFGHSGVFPGCQSHSCVVPGLGVTISLIVNAPDIVPASIVDGLIAILAAYKDKGPAAPNLAAWSGRWWSGWGAVDLLAMGRTIAVAVPTQLNPFTDASEIIGISGDRGVIGTATGFTNHRETARLERDPSGAVARLWLGGIRYGRETDIAEAVTAKYHVAR